MVAEKLELLLDSLVLDAQGEILAEMARSLAETLDVSRGSSNGSVVAAMAPISKELGDLVRRIVEKVGESDDFERSLFAEVGDSAQS